ncbi:MAG TPA: diaminopimelate decarboxylase [Candidatus Limnocylindrales bacterium]|nr:diaminopimelate decarboxylase [Candidatus Limnocylindrales bacterium]
MPITAPFHAMLAYHAGQLHLNAVPLAAIARATGTPAYVYSLPRILHNLEQVRAAFPDSEVHFSAKSNHNLALLRTLIEAGAGIDAVSAGEIQLALAGGARPQDIVLAGVAKTPDELRFAVAHGIGWVNIENVHEAELLNAIAAEHGVTVRAALRYNPEVAANTHPHIATGHSAAKFGLNADDVRALLARRAALPQLRIEGLHVHIGSQLHDTVGTGEAVRHSLALIEHESEITTLNIGGGFPVAYHGDEALPSPADFAAAILPLVRARGLGLLLEPGRSLVADAGVLLTQVLYVKDQGDQRFVLVDAGMTELIRPMLYEAHHAIVPLTEGEPVQSVTVAGPVCESTDVFGHAVPLPDVQPGDLLAVLTCGAYGMVMASNYNARLRPPEVVIETGGTTWRVARRRETTDDLLRLMGQAL